MTACVSCGEGDEQRCAASKRECGHHCNHAWSHDGCCWCGARFGETDADAGACDKPVWPSEGERVAGRLLLKEVRQGVTHYVPGQYEATYCVGGEDFFTHEPLDIARLTYVDQMGHLCCVLLSRRDVGDEWRVTWAGRSGQTYTSPARKIEKPDEFRLSDAMCEALANAKEVPWPT